jgi:shikimate dehydrogenase
VGDVVAGHGVTPRLQAAQAAGCATADGVARVEARMANMPAFLLGE